MEILTLVRLAHIVGATVLMGTGAGIAFFMVMAHRTRDPKIIAYTADVVVIADWIFTTSAVVVQPITGILLAHMTGWSLSEGWIVLSLGLYVLVGVFWLPVIWIQHKLRDLARHAVVTKTALPMQYFRLYQIWFFCGFPAFSAVLTIIWLMIARPSGLF